MASIKTQFTGKRKIGCKATYDGVVQPPSGFQGHYPNMHYTLGVIGHVDHGKTSLVMALSGMDTDRLKEEKERGMSIVLGFAHLAFDEGMIDLIDVPGHESFVRTMISGATGIDAALLVIDIKEGIKPQTAEHLAITELIGVRRGVISLNKCDIATPQERAAALARLRTGLKGSYLEFAPVVFTSARTNEGIDELKQALKGLFRPRSSGNGAPSFYLPIDRVFSVAGRGTVVTGTLRLGCLRVGDVLELMPRGATATVRQLEFHNRTVEEAFPGQRVGVNLRHVKPQDLNRGDTLASPGLLKPSMLLNVQLQFLKTERHSLRSGQSLRLLFGTTTVAARVRLLTADAIDPGDTALAQLSTAQPVVAVAGESFILRSESPAATLGGGRILDPVAVPVRRSNTEARRRLQVLAEGSTAETIGERLKAAGYAGIAIGTLATILGIGEGQVQAALQDGIAIMIDETHALYRPFFDSLAEMVAATVMKFHRQHPIRAGVPLSQCRAGVPHSVSANVFRQVVRQLVAGKRIEVMDNLVRSFGYDPMSVLNERDMSLAVDLEHRIRQGGLMPPDVEQVAAKNSRAEELLFLLAERGTLILLQGEQPGRRVAFHRDAVSDAIARIRDAFPPPQQFTVSEARALLGSTRKFIVPLMEYCDTAGHTRRSGDKRKLVEKYSG